MAAVRASITRAAALKQATAHGQAIDDDGVLPPPLAGNATGAAGAMVGDGVGVGPTTMARAIGAGAC